MPTAAKRSLFATGKKPAPTLSPKKSTTRAAHNEEPLTPEEFAGLENTRPSNWWSSKSTESNVQRPRTRCETHHLFSWARTFGALGQYEFLATINIRRNRTGMWRAPQ